MPSFSLPVQTRRSHNRINLTDEFHQIMSAVGLRRSSLWRRENRDSIAAKRPDPEFFSNLNGHSARAKLGAVRVANDFLNFQRVRIDLHDV